MTLPRRSLLAAAASAAALPSAVLPRRARAQGAGGTVKIGVLNDGSGPYRDISGQHGLNAAKLAVKDFGAALNVEVLYADHQNKPDVGAGIARQWIDQDGVSLVIDVNTSSVALAVNGVCREKNCTYVNVGAATGDLTGPQCTPVTVHWSYDTYMLAQSTGGATVRSGGKTWYFLTADYVFGQQLQRDTTGFIEKEGGKVLGASKYPFPGTTDFSSFLISAQSSGAQVLGLANAGADTVNSIKQAHEFGLTQQMKVAALLMYITDVHGLGLETAQGLFLTESWYWDLDDRTRKFTKHWQSVDPNTVPNMDNAGVYGGTLHFLKAVQAIGAANARDGASVVAKMKALPVQDDVYGSASVREDGLVLLPAYLFQVKSPAESKGPWDYYKLIQTTGVDKAWKPLAEEGCPLIRS